MSNLIVHENSDLCLTTYWRISNKQWSLNFINQLKSRCASSRVRVWCASTWKTSKSSEVLKFDFAADQSWHIYTSLTCTWERKGTLSLGLVMQLYYRLVSEGHQLLCIFLFVIRKWHLWNRYSESKPKTNAILGTGQANETWWTW